MCILIYRLLHDKLIVAVMTLFSACVPGIHPGYSIHCESFPHTREFAKQAGTQVAHDATMLAAKALATVGARVLIEQEFYESVYKSWEAAVPPQFR